jgi:hypothetical protein
MDPNHSLDIDIVNNILHEVFRMEPGFNQIHTACKPFLCLLALLQPDVSSCLKLSDEFTD